MATPNVLTDYRRHNLLLAILLAMMAYMSVLLIFHLRAHQNLAEDLAELRHVKYGMLNANSWVAQVSDIAEIEIRRLEFEGKRREALKAALERVLDTLITEADKHIREQHASGDWWDRTTGKVKESMRNTLMDVESVKAGIPDYAEQIILELEKPETRQQLSAFLDSMVQDFTLKTYSEVDDSKRQAIYIRYNCEKSSECKKIIKDRIKVMDTESTHLALLILLCATLMFLLGWRAMAINNRAPLVMLSLAAMVLLLCGVLTPMMEVEAQIIELKFVLIGHPVEFYNELFYFQSKSVLDVVATLMAKGDVDLVLVGILITTFSVIFPSLKLLASMAFIYGSANLRRSKVIEFFALKSSKWSMADVMVVAIFMAYIGFNAMISSQMELFTKGATSAGANVVTSEGSSLQIGFFMFLAFCIAGLLVSTFMERVMVVGNKNEKRI